MQRCTQLYNHQSKTTTTRKLTTWLRKKQIWFTLLWTSRHLVILLIEIWIDWVVLRHSLEMLRGSLRSSRVETSQLRILEVVIIIVHQLQRQYLHNQWLWDIKVVSSKVRLMIKDLRVNRTMNIQKLFSRQRHSRDPSIIEDKPWLTRINQEKLRCLSIKIRQKH